VIAAISGPHIDWAGLSSLTVLLGAAIVVLLVGLLRPRRSPASSANTAPPSSATIGDRPAQSMCGPLRANGVMATSPPPTAVARSAAVAPRCHRAGSRPTDRVAPPAA